MPAQQQHINYGNTANDGQGDALRTAFVKVDDNFDAIWNAGPVGSNVTILNNTVQTVNANGNLLISANGVGVIKTLSSLVPRFNNTSDLGIANLRYRAAYIGTGGANILGNLTVSGTTTFSGDVGFPANVSVAGNLTVEGDIIQIGNIVTDTLTIQLANTATNAGQANGAGITVGAEDDIATLLYNDLTDTWHTNIGITAVGTISGTGLVVSDATVNGNVTADFFTGNGSQLLGINTLGDLTISNANIQLAEGVSNTSIFIRPSGPGGDAYIKIPDNASSFESGLSIVNDNGYVEIQAKNGEAAQSWYFREDGTLELPGNVEAHIKSDEAIIIQTGTGDHWEFGLDNVLTTPGDIVPDTGNAYSLGNATNYWANLWVANNTIYIGGVPLGITAGNVLTVAGEPVLSNDSDSSITTTGNITANYLIGDGSLLTGISSTGNITFSDTTISAPDDESMTLQVRDVDEAVRSTLLLDSNDGLTRWSSLSSEQETSYNTGDWSTATWTGNSLDFVDAPNIVAFVDTGDYNGTVNKTFSINGGTRLPYDGASYGGNNISFSTTVAADPDPTTVTTISFYYQFQSQIQMDHDDEEILIQAQGMDIQITGDDDIRIQAADNIDIEASGSIDIDSDEQIDIRSYSITDPVRIITDASTGTTIWAFGADGTLTTPGDITVAGDVTGTAGANTLVLKAQPASNTLIQLNSIVDSVISTVANLEIRTDVSNTAKTWEFDTTGDFTAPGNITANYFLGNGSQLTDVNAVTVDVTDTNGLTTIYYPTFVENRTTGQIARADVDLTYRTDDNILTVGNVSVAGNITGGNLSVTGNISANTAGFAIGYRDIPQVSFTGNATIATTDAGKHFYSTQSSNYILTIANNASQGFQTGAAMTIVNQGTGNITVAQASGVTLYLAGNATSGNRTVATFGMATIMKVATDTWFINGTGVS